ncbi:MAG TPA: hypothetical protein VIJ93_14770 [bacterium]
MVFSPPVQQIGRLYAAYFSISFIFLTLLFGNLWLMRKWTVWAYGLYFIINQLICLTYGIWSPRTLLPLIVWVILCFYYRRMG